MVSALACFGGEARLFQRERGARAKSHRKTVVNAHG